MEFVKAERRRRVEWPRLSLAPHLAGVEAVTVCQAAVSVSASVKQRRLLVSSVTKIQPAEVQPDLLAGDPRDVPEQLAGRHTPQSEAAGVGSEREAARQLHLADGPGVPGQGGGGCPAPPASH